MAKAPIRASTSKVYQGLISQVATDKLPVVLPRYHLQLCRHAGRSGAGGFSLDTGMFNVLRTDGTNTRRANLTMNWERPFSGAGGRFVEDHAAWRRGGLRRIASSTSNRITACVTTSTRRRRSRSVAVDMTLAVDARFGSWGTQLIEPHLQLVAAAQNRRQSARANIPNEDSLDVRILRRQSVRLQPVPGHRSAGRRRRLNAALHGAWYLGGTTFDGLVGQSYQAGVDNLFPESSGLHDQVSDIVARASFSPTPWLDMTYRTRLDKESFRYQHGRCLDVARHRQIPPDRGISLYHIRSVLLLRHARSRCRRRSGYFQPRNEATARCLQPTGGIIGSASWHGGIWRPTR